MLLAGDGFPRSETFAELPLWETAWRRWLVFLAGNPRTWIPAFVGMTVAQRE